MPPLRIALNYETPVRHSRARGNPVEKRRLWIPNQVGNDDKKDFRNSKRIDTFPRAILHIDADAFFASCEQAVHPEWKGRPVITGQERGIVSAASYEAKKRGISRGTPLWDVKKICPDAIIVPSDYETVQHLLDAHVRDHPSVHTRH